MDVQSEKYHASGGWRDHTLIDDFRHRARIAHPERAAIIAHRADAPVRTLSFGLLDRIVDQWACALLELGVEPGDVVSFQLPNWWQFTALHLACARIGAVTNAILPILRHREVGFILGRLNPKVCVVPSVYRGHDHAAMMAALTHELAAPPRVFVITDPDSGPDHAGTGAEGVTSFEAFFGDPRWHARHAHCLDAHRPRPDDIAQIQFTSGTTGEPKGVVHTWNTVYAGMRIVPEALDVHEGHTVLAVSPMAHTVGFYFGVTMPISYGMTAVLQDVWDPVTMVRLAHEHGATWTMVPPTFLSDLCAALPADTRMPQGFRLSTAGAPVPAPLLRRVRERLGTPVFTLWGMTEVGAFTTTRPGDPGQLDLDSDGTPMPWNEVRVADAAGEELPVGSEGRLLVRGASVFTAYHGRPDLYEASFDARGWFDSGDLARRLPGGGIRLCGRVKDLIIRGGENIPAVEVEAGLLRHPGVREVAVVAVPDERLGERACAVIVPSDPTAAPDLSALLAHLAAIGMARHFWPESLVVRASLPRTTTGKVQKFLLRKELASSGTTSTGTSRHPTTGQPTDWVSSTRSSRA